MTPLNPVNVTIRLEVKLAGGNNEPKTFAIL